MSAAECIMFFLEAVHLTSCSPLVDSVLGQTMLKFPVDGFNHLCSGRRDWHRCWVPNLLHWWGDYPWCRIVS
jgi:hypothetical protein